MNEYERGKPAKEIEMPPLPPEEITQNNDTASEEDTTPNPAEVLNSPIVPQPEQTSVPEPSYTKNLRAMRESKERSERERDEALRQLEAERAQRNSGKLSTFVDENDDIQLAPDDLAEGKHLTQVSAKIKRLEDQLKHYQQQSSLSTTEVRLKNEYPDFDKIVSKDNVELLNLTYPELAHSVNSATDLYMKAKSAYLLIKKLGIHVEDTYQQDRDLAQRNASKPRPLASVSPQQGDSPLSRANAFANGLTDDLRKQLHKEMIEAAKNR